MTISERCVEMSNKKKQTVSGKPSSNNKSANNPAPAKQLKDATAFNKRLSLIQNILFVLVMIVVFYPVFLRGLFFETNQLWTEIIIFILFTIFATIKYLKKEKFVFNTLLDYASLAFVVVYALSMISAVYLRDALSEWLKYCMYFTVFFMLSDMLMKKKQRIRILWVIAASGTGVALLGLDGATGANLAGMLNRFANLLGYKNELFFKLYDAGAVNSTLQYPNAAAAYFVAIFFVLVGLTMLSEKIWEKLLAGVLGFIVLETFILTLSKGGYLTMAAAALIFVIVLPKKSRAIGFIDVALHFVVAGALHHFITEYLSESRYIDFLFLLLAGMAATLLLDLLVCRFEKRLEKITWKTYAAAFGVLAVIAIAGISLVATKTDILPDNIFSSISSFFKSTSYRGRMTFYKDGLKMFSQRPFLGYGGGGWQFVYQQHQSYLYWSTLPHNFPLQLGVESGIFGIFAYLALIAGIAIYYVKYRRKKDAPLTDKLIAATVVTAIAAILGHSLIDFDLSLAAIFLLLWELLAVLNAIFRGEGLILGKEPIVTKIKEVEKKNKAIPVLAIILATALAIIPCVLKSAEVQAADANELFNAGDRAKAINMMKGAMTKDTLNASYKIDYANMATSVTYTNTDLLAINKIADEAYLQANNNPDLVAKLYQYYMYTGNYNMGLIAANRITQLRPFWPNAWAAKTNALFQIGIYLFSQMDNENALKYMQSTVNVKDEVKEVNKLNAKPLILSSEALSDIEKAKYVIDNIEAGKTIDIDNLIFEYIPGMDVDGDNMPDQWIIRNQKDVSIADKDGIMTITDHNAEKNNYIESRTLMLETNSEYMIGIVMEEGNVPDTLRFIIPNTTKVVKIEGDGGNFSGTFKTEDAVGNNRGLVIYIDNGMKIKSVVIEKIG